MFSDEYFNLIFRNTSSQTLDFSCNFPSCHHVTQKLCRTSKFFRMNDWDWKYALHCLLIFAIYVTNFQIFILYHTLWPVTQNNSVGPISLDQWRHAMCHRTLENGIGVIGPWGGMPLPRDGFTFHSKMHHNLVEFELMTLQARACSAVEMMTHQARAICHTNLICSMRFLPPP